LNLSSQLKTLNWRWILSISQVVLALALFLMLRAELKVHDAQFEAALAQGWDFRTEFDYVPHLFVWMVVFDFPAIVAVAPFGIAHTRIGPVFVLFAGLFWYWCGRGMEQRLKGMDEMRKSPGIVASVLNGMGLICALALLVSLLWTGSGASGLILYGSVVAWCAAFVAYFGARLTRRWPSRNNISNAGSSNEDVRVLVDCSDSRCSAL
jgi:hypothetical protein